ncbi:MULTISPECIES: hypothetical protein [unclassified Kitasatospora]|uniref:hypothetical protein n=1 Tax=unclassified Kitasatospora TaxID=2633591 RepID=UPI0033D5ACA2
MQLVRPGEERSRAVARRLDLTDDDTTRTHAAVRPRHLTGHTTHCAVISPLPEGDYTIWRTPDSPDTTCTIRGGEVTEHHWS